MKETRLYVRVSAAKRKYNERNYFRVALTIPISKAESLKQYAKEHDTNVNKLLNDYKVYCLIMMLTQV